MTIAFGVETQHKEQELACLYEQKVAQQVKPGAIRIDGGSLKDYVAIYPRSGRQLVKQLDAELTTKAV